MVAGLYYYDHCDHCEKRPASPQSLWCYLESGRAWCPDCLKSTGKRHTRYNLTHEHVDGFEEPRS